MTDDPNEKMLDRLQACFDHIDESIANLAYEIGDTKDRVKLLEIQVNHLCQTIQMDDLSRRVHRLERHRLGLPDADSCHMPTNP